MSISPHFKCNDCVRQCDGRKSKLAGLCLSTNGSKHKAPRRKMKAVGLVAVRTGKKVNADKNLVRLAHRFKLDAVIMMGLGKRRVPC